MSTNLVSIGEQAFKDCSSLKNIKIPESLDALSSETFANCTSLSKVDLGNNLNTIGPSAFKGCTSLQKIEIPMSVYGFGVESFSGCTSLQFVKLTDGIKSIGKNAFNGCTGLEGVEFSKNLVSIGEGTFTNCDSLKMIRSWAEIPPEGLPNFSDTVYKAATVYIPEASTEDYKESPTWEKFFNFKTITSDIKANSLTLNKKAISFYINETDTLTAKVTPSFATDTTIVWTSKDESVAKVDKDGVVTAIGDGMTMIIASTTDGELKDTCYVLVITPASSITFNENTINIKVGESMQLKATILPAEASQNSILWSSSDEEVCKVSNDGLITAVSTGECVISATTSSSSTSKIKAECTVIVTDETTGIETVKDNSSYPIEVYNINGQRKNKLTRGINIIKKKGEPAKKVIVR